MFNKVLCTSLSGAYFEEVQERKNKQNIVKITEPEKDESKTDSKNNIRECNCIRTRLF